VFHQYHHQKGFLLSSLFIFLKTPQYYFTMKTTTTLIAMTAFTAINTALAHVDCIYVESNIREHASYCQGKTKMEMCDSISCRGAIPYLTHDYIRYCYLQLGIGSANDLHIYDNFDKYCQKHKWARRPHNN
jgi:hypothetical protein